MLSLVTVSTVITAFHSCCLSHHYQKEFPIKTGRYSLKFYSKNITFDGRNDEVLVWMKTGTTSSHEIYSSLDISLIFQVNLSTCIKQKEKKSFIFLTGPITFQLLVYYFLIIKQILSAFQNKTCLSCSQNKLVMKCCK